MARDKGMLIDPNAAVQYQARTTKRDIDYAKYI